MLSTSGTCDVTTQGTHAVHDEGVQRRLAVLVRRAAEAHGEVALVCLASPTTLRVEKSMSDPSAQKTCETCSPDMPAGSARARLDDKRV